jgi:hypothetical protein
MNSHYYTPIYHNILIKNAAGMLSGGFQVINLFVYLLAII